MDFIYKVCVFVCVCVAVSSSERGELAKDSDTRGLTSVNSERTDSLTDETPTPRTVGITDSLGNIVHDHSKSSTSSSLANTSDSDNKLTTKSSTNEDKLTSGEGVRKELTKTSPADLTTTPVSVSTLSSEATGKLPVTTTESSQPQIAITRPPALDVAGPKHHEDHSFIEYADERSNARAQNEFTLDGMPRNQQPQSSSSTGALHEVTDAPVTTNRQKFPETTVEPKQTSFMDMSTSLPHVVHKLTESTTTNELSNVNEDNTSSTPSPITTQSSNAYVQQSSTRIPEETHRKEKQMTQGESQSCPCDRHSMSSFDMSRCPGERVLPNPDCPCKMVCTRQVNQSCNKSLPCDEEFGLQCVHDTCQGELNAHAFDITHNSAKIRWGSEKSEIQAQASLSYTTTFRGSHTQWIEIQPLKPVTVLERLLPNVLYFYKVEQNGKQEIEMFQTKDGCIFNGTVSFAVGEKFNVSCNQTCTCYPGGEPECHDRCYYVPVDMRHPSCVEVPDEDDPCCIRLQCKDDVIGSPPKVLVTQKSPSTLTVVWDDFKLPSHYSQYVLEYRQAVNNNNNSWYKVQAGSHPILTVTQLKPNTAYQVRVVVSEEGDGKHELPSEVVTVHTEDGCVSNNKTYSVGEEFFYGCDLRCTCEGGNGETCNPRCNMPYIKAGTKPDDPMCYEKPLASDPCCATVRCSEGKSLEHPDEETSTKSKAGECPEITEESLPSANSCLSDCDHDGDCGSNMKCCPSSCGGAVCVHPVLFGNICENINCGPNAKCVVEKMSCECMDEFEGNPNDFLNGCKPSMNTKGNGSVPTAEAKSIHHQDILPPSMHPDTYGNHDNQENSLTVATEPPFELDLSSRNASEIHKIGESMHNVSPHMLNETNGRSNGMHKEEEDSLNVTDVEENKSKDSKKKQATQDGPTPFSGCEFNNITYDQGVRFEDGCEARCVCDGPGHVSCVPRCSIMSSGGKNCKEVPDPDDACCQIMVCSFPGNEDMENVEELTLKILSAEPQNGTRIRIRLAISSTHLPTKVGQESLEVWFAMESGRQSDLAQWNKRPVSLKELTEVQQGVFEFDVDNLVPGKEYFFKVASENQGASKLHMAEFSNTVNVKTFPAAVKTTFQGCFHHNQSYNLGEVFYQGCEFKCICRENGFIECQDRCEIYIDTVGYEGCDWIPAEEDACCMVPSCQRRKIPLLPGSRLPPFVGPVENMCVVNSNEFYRVGDIWELDDGCKTKVCRCAMLPNGTTTIQCQSECPALPPNAHIPTARCPNPVLVKPEGPCSCPYISCNEPPRRVVQSPPLPQCEFKGKRYNIGQEFHDGCIALCHCSQDLRVSCATIECPYHFSAEFTNCLEWDIDPNFFPVPPQCCAPSKCKNDGSCIFSGQKFNNFADIPGELLPCGARCVCVNGNITCENRCPPVEDVPPSNLPCPPSLAYKDHPAGESCCLRWMCRDPPKQAYCMFQGARYFAGEQWQVRKGSSHRICSCERDQSGDVEVHCKGGCPQIPQRFLLPSEQCARPVIVTPDDPVMCPYVVCNNSVTAQELYNINVLALNSTAVRIRFTLANILVGLVGHAELHFTTDPTLPPSEWHVQKFSRPKRLFDSPNIEYILNALRPNTTYFLQVKIKIDALQGGPESELFKLKMPEETTSPPPPPTTTLPPIIMLDAKAEVQVIDANTARISWRNFEPQEKKFIYAVQLKYKMDTDSDDKWITTPMIHRDVTSYFLHDLVPSSSYTVDVIFTAPKEMSTKLISAKSLEFRTTGKTKDDYNLHVSVSDNKVESQSTEFSLTGIPEPISKYVHVVKILYKTPDGKQLYSFKVPKTNKLELDHLEPSRKYLAQMELYLTNGKTLTSNEVEFITKAAKQEVSANANFIDGRHTNGKQAEPLQSKEVKEEENKAYFIALVVVAVVAAVAGFGFVLLLVLLVRRQASAKAPISRTPSESAYDNPTYKTYDGERLEDKTNGQAIQTTQA